MDKNTHCCKSRSRSSKPAGRSPMPLRTWMPAVSQQCWEGLNAPLKARTAASGGQRAFTRAARKRRAQVCGEVMVQSDGRWAGSPHPPLTRSPFPYEGKDLTRSKVGKTANVDCNTSEFRRAKRCCPGTRMCPFTSAGGAKPIAAMQTDAGCLAAAWGGLEGFTSPHH